MSTRGECGGGPGGAGNKRPRGRNEDRGICCSDCQCALGGPGQAQAARLSCGCADRCGACVGAAFLEALPSPEAPEFRGFECPSCATLVGHYAVGARTVQLGHVWKAVLPPWHASFQLHDSCPPADGISISLSAAADDGSLRVMGGTYGTSEDDCEPSGVLRADLVRICAFIGAVICAGQRTVVTPRCDNLNDYARAAIDDTSLFHQCMRALVLGICSFRGDKQEASGDVDVDGGAAKDAEPEFDAAPIMPEIADLASAGAERQNTCGVWTIVNIVRKLRNPKMVSGAPGFLSRAVMNHDRDKVSSVLSSLCLGVSRSTIAHADADTLEKKMEAEIVVESGDAIIGGFDNMVCRRCATMFCHITRAIVPVRQKRVATHVNWCLSVFFSPTLSGDSAGHARTRVVCEFCCHDVSTRQQGEAAHVGPAQEEEPRASGARAGPTERSPVDGCRGGRLV